MRQPLLKRTECLLDFPFQGAVPSKGDVAKSLAKQHNVDESFVQVETIKPIFGSHKARVHGFIYEDVALKAFLHPVKAKKEKKNG